MSSLSGMIASRQAEQAANSLTEIAQQEHDQLSDVTLVSEESLQDIQIWRTNIGKAYSGSVDSTLKDAFENAGASGGLGALAEKHQSQRMSLLTEIDGIENVRPSGYYHRKEVEQELQSINSGQEEIRTLHEEGNKLQKTTNQSQNETNQTLSTIVDILRKTDWTTYVAVLLPLLSFLQGSTNTLTQIGSVKITPLHLLLVGTLAIAVYCRNKQ